MNVIPNINVQLIHIEGPLKGKIQEYSTTPILIGRHPDCQVQFPKGAVTLSRLHAQIVREGNRFKVIDKSTNGTFVNGQRIAEAHLKNGDVITIADGGPKLSFLTQVSDQPPLEPPTPHIANTPQGSLSPPMAPAPSPHVQPVDPPPPQPPAVHTVHAVAQPSTATPAPPPEQPAPVASTPAPVVHNINVPFAIQYGPILKSFQSLPITLGKGADCDFVVNHPGLNDQQVQFFFSRDQYWIKDLTGTNTVLINTIPIAGQAVLQPEMLITLSPLGPKFRFLGGGRLVEIEDPLPETPAQAPPSAPVTPPKASKDQNRFNAAGQKGKKLFKRFFSQ
jgi:pSer/pThr/pTyr-binding forkhead associated (FHA) protein